MIKIALGIGVSLSTIGVFLIPIHLIFRIYIFFVLFTAAGMFMSLRIKAIEKKCNRCEWKGNWYQCPGFEELNSKLEDNDLLKRDRARKWEIARKKSRL